MHREISEIELPLEIVWRPARIKSGSLMSGIGADGRVANVDDRVGDKIRLQRLVHDRADEAAASAHQELAIPHLGQEQREFDLRADDAGHAAVGDRNRPGRRRRNGDRFGHLHIRQPQPHQVRAHRVIGRNQSGCPRQRDRHDQSSQ